MSSRTLPVLVLTLRSSLGLGLVKGYAARPNHTVIATVRNPSSMPDVPIADGSKVVTVRMEATNVNDPKKVGFVTISARLAPSLM